MVRHELSPAPSPVCCRFNCIAQGSRGLSLRERGSRVCRQSRCCGYNTYRGWTEIDCLDRHWNTDQKEDGTLDDRRRDGGTNSTLRTKEQGTHLTLNEHDDDDEIIGFHYRNQTKQTHCRHNKVYLIVQSRWYIQYSYCWACSI
jgi:hypothetical protein